ncbi:MAG: hypothetical protein ACKO81_05740 [Planctomycetota bacterium]
MNAKSQQLSRPFDLVDDAVTRVGLVTPEPAEPLFSSQGFSDRNGWPAMVA